MKSLIAITIVISIVAIASDAEDTLIGTWEEKEFGTTIRVFEFQEDGTNVVLNVSTGVIFTRHWAIEQNDPPLLLLWDQDEDRNDAFIVELRFVGTDWMTLTYCDICFTFERAE